MRGDNVEEQRFIALSITDQNIGLPRGAHRHHLIRIKITQRFQTKTASDCLTYRRRAGRAPYQHHAIDGIDVSVSEGLAARIESALDIGR